ncbi:5-formyltetrahydrofolate cyclo-ligase [Paenibacillus sp. GP183]|uniref:5-formyltetrahydrofolate cyclo-ligase n=1 Tax=Paenibacillus sp. GP183 TaxID=1882751 RepID=UPI00089B508A|nr:5-formyltetrahydrofolate cyclo-ligase [Paenibacillus sp. GP183]SEC14250.1 5-formyltetrahydrofolate cyclo-ligase [Paenibacillus sp. GP183]
MNIRERKIELRQEIEKKRALLTAEERSDKQRIINQKLVALAKERILPLTVFTYMPFRSEPDVTPFMEWCWKESIRVLLPRVIKETRSFVLHAVNGYGEIESNSWGIREPKVDLPMEDQILSISMILVPGLAFDTDLGRLGYGGGFYDRFMQLYSSRGLDRPYSVAAAFDVQVVPEVPVSWHDFRLDGLITESLNLQQPSR